MADMKINNRRDILLLLLYSPGAHDRPNEPIVGRTRLVKMLFLFKTEALSQFKMGTDINDDNFYEFFAWNFGPFSRQVYDDLTFFTLRGFVEATAAEEDTLPESAAEWEMWLSASGADDEDEPVVDYNEEEFKLTNKGFAFAQNLYGALNDNQKKMLRAFKSRMVKSPLRAILKYVYETYPEQTDKSQIRERVLGSG